VTIQKSNAKEGPLTPAAALRFLSIAWPEFVVEDDVVLIRRERERARAPLSSFPSLREAECFINHVHVLDELEHNASLKKEPYWNSRAADFARGIEIARVLAETWAAKLAADFPARSFVVYATRDDNPIVRFHAVRPREPAWLSVDDVERSEAGSVMRIRVARGKIAERHGELKPRRGRKRRSSAGKS
jgi:hypothetical protein